MKIKNNQNCPMSYIGDYVQHGQIGQGGQANVYLCRKKNQFYAAKVYMPGNSKLQAFRKQVQFLSKLNYKHLINIVQYKQNTPVKFINRNQVTRPVIIQQYALGGQLFDYISKQGPFPAKVCRVLIKHILSAIQYLNSVGVTHRDLKPQNILFDKNFTIKVTDFGLSTLAQGHQGDGYLYTKVGTEGYKAPQVQQGKYIGLQGDIFSIGVVLFIIYCGTPPFLSTKQGDRIYNLYRNNKLNTFWTMHERRKPSGYFSQSFKKLLNSFFSVDTSKRPTLQSLKNDQWLNGQCASQQQIVMILQQRRKRLIQTDPVKKKIQQQRLHILKHAMEQQDNSGNRDISYQTVKQFQQIDLNQLPKSSNPNLILINQTPNFILTWIDSSVKSLFNKNDIFIQNSVLQIKPVNYNVSLQQNDKIRISFMFSTKLQENQNPQIQQISLILNLYSMENNQIGLSIKKQIGNSFWLSCAAKKIQQQIRIIS